MADSMSLQTALAFSKNAVDIPMSEHCTFDFARTGNTEPFAMLIVSSEIRKFLRERPNTKVSCVNFGHMHYAAHMGFFRAFGLEHGKKPGEAKGSSRYIPMRILDCAALRQEAIGKGLEVGEQIEKNSEEIASLLTNGDSSTLHETLTYSIREIMRNVLEHSQSSRLGICAQYWPSKNKVEVAILDRGIGLRKSLSPNPHIDTTTDKNAINFSLMPAISGKSFKGSKNKSKGPWANSGFGLYMTNRICRNGGNFFIGSGNAGLLLTQGNKKWHECNLDGTAVRMVINTEQLPALKESLARYREDGYEFQKEYQEIVNIDPSSASLMLSEDFEPSAWQKVKERIKRERSKL